MDDAMRQYVEAGRPVDWSRPIEAVHEDGRVEGALLGYERQDGLNDVMWPSGSGAFYDNGMPRADWSWTIRNVVPQEKKMDDYLAEIAAERDMLLSNRDRLVEGDPGWYRWDLAYIAMRDLHDRLAQSATPAPKYPDALVERAFVAIRAHVVGDPCIDDSRTVEAEFRAIVAELPAEVDADRKAAKVIAQDHGLVKVNWSHNDQCEEAILAAIKRGRALERQHAGEGRGG